MTLDLLVALTALVCTAYIFYRMGYRRGYEAALDVFDSSTLPKRDEDHDWI